MNFEIPKLAWLKVVSLAAAKNDVRYYLNGVMIRNGEIAATNGHMLLLIKSESIKSDSIKSDGEYIIGNDTIKLLINVHKFIKGDNPVKVAHGMTTRNMISIIPIDGKFPDVNRVIIQDPSGEIGQFSYEYLLSCRKANNVFLGHNHPWIKLQHNGQAGAKFESEDEDGNKLIGVVMPVRI